MFKFFFKPKIKAKLIRGGSAVKVSVINATAEQTIIILFLAVKQIAKGMGMDFRQMMNKLVDLDKTIIKAQNHDKKIKYQQEQKVKHRK